MKFSVLPAVHAEHGAILDYPEGGTRREALVALGRAHGEVYVVDAMGVRRNAPDLDFLRDASRLLPLWADAGSRYAADAMDTLVGGASRVTLRWNTVDARAELEELAAMADPGTFHVGLEFSDKGFLPNPGERGATPEALGRSAAELGLGVVVQSTAPFDPALARRLASAGAERWWYGVLDREAAIELKRLGYAGVIVPASMAKELGTFEDPKPEQPPGDAGAERP